MKAREILSHVDHTLLKQTATWAQMQRVAEEAIRYGTATVMVPSCYVARLAHIYGARLKVATVVGFPNGNAATAAKIAETAQRCGAAITSGEARPAPRLRRLQHRERQLPRHLMRRAHGDFQGGQRGRARHRGAGVVADTDDPCAPCGMCRQAISEFHIPRILMGNLKGEVREVTLAERLPFAFSESDLG